MRPAGHHDTSRIDDAVAYRILRAARRLRYGLAHALDAWGTGLSPEQFVLLFRVLERDGLTQRELGDPLLDDRPNISRIVAALEGRGWVERRPDPADRRVKRIHSTPEGRAFFDTLRPRIVEERQRIFGGISDERLEVFLDVLETVEELALP